MSSYTIALGGSAARPTITHDGKVYIFGALDHRTKSAFERRLIDEAMRAASLAPEPYASRAVAEVVRDAARGVYAFHGEIAQQATQSPSGMIALTAILLGVDEEQAIRLAADCPLEVAAKLDLVILEALPQQVRERVLREREQATQESTTEGEADPTGPARASA